MCIRDRVGSQAFAVMRLLQSFPDTIQKAMQKNEPSMITRHIIDLAQAFNRFYYDIRIIDENTEATAARIQLTSATATVLKTGLSLLGIQAPEHIDVYKRQNMVCLLSGL